MFDLNFSAHRIADAEVWKIFGNGIIEFDFPDCASFIMPVAVMISEIFPMNIGVEDKQWKI